MDPTVSLQHSPSLNEELVNSVPLMIFVSPAGHVYLITSLSVCKGCCASDRHFRLRQNSYDLLTILHKGCCSHGEAIFSGVNLAGTVYT